MNTISQKPVESSLSKSAIYVVANRTPEGQKITGAVASDIDYPFASLMTVLLLMFSFLTYYILFLAPTQRSQIQNSMKNSSQSWSWKNHQSHQKKRRKMPTQMLAKGQRAKKEEGKVEERMPKKLKVSSSKSTSVPKTRSCG